MTRVRMYEPSAGAVALMGKAGVFRLARKLGLDVEAERADESLVREAVRMILTTPAQDRRTLVRFLNEGYSVTLARENLRVQL